MDTNIVLYLLNGDAVLAELLFQKKLYLSFVSQLELMAYKGLNHKQQNEISKFIQDCIVIDINNEIKIETVNIRKNSRLKLPDAIVLATARFLSLPLITADQDFKQIESSEIIIYE
ncbi:MAG: type II toxin-antitoxin system VapC family toxin [Cytophagales bacterium]